MTLLIRGARVVTCDDERPTLDGDVRVDAGLVAELGVHLEPRAGEAIFHADGRVLLPGFVDAHTHAMFAGDRLHEFELALAGKSYLEILEAGGGILSTVRAVRQSTEDELREGLTQRLRHVLTEGTTSIEVKSGYGLSTGDELKMLRAIRAAAADFPGTIIGTALLGHAQDPAEPHFVDRVVEETLPAVHAEFPEVAIDAYCERGAWSVEDCRRLFERARDLGHPLRLHTDQFTAMGGVELALELGALSVDHLEAATPSSLARIAQSGAFGVMLPVSGFHTDERYGKGRALIDAGGRLVLASNYNPGSSPCSSLPFVIALAVRKLGVSAREAIQACTSSAAALLGLGDRGKITPGARADLVLLRHTDERMLAFEIGGNPVERVWVGGQAVERGALREAEAAPRA